MEHTAKFIIVIAICLGAGFLGSVFTMPAIPTWYAALNKPAFSPPNSVFAPVWTALYIMMGIAAYIIWTDESNKGANKVALAFFALQLFLNVLWSFLFFGLQSPLMALIDIALLWLSILLTMIFFWRISAGASLLLLPYILWVSFASVLNYYIFILNR